MSGKDLTRWNRAGLDRFRYVNGNAATHLEALRKQFASDFAEWNAVKLQEDNEPDRVIRQYRGERREWAWEVSRTFSRALHILTEHMDAFANEGYLRTATQWDHGRQLVAMTGYAPAPASSASTQLAIIVPDDADAGTVEAGLQVKHTPEDGSPPVLFETLEELQIDRRLNRLKLKGWDFNPGGFNEKKNGPFEPLSADPLWPLPDDVKVAAGEYAILSGASLKTALVVSVDAVSEAKDALAIADPGGDPPEFKLSLGNARLRVSPRAVLTPALNGKGVVRLEKDHNLVAGEVIAWKSKTRIEFARIAEADRGSIVLELPSETAPPPAGASIFKAKMMTPATRKANNDEWRFPLDAGNKIRSEDFRFVSITSKGALSAPAKLDNATSQEVTIEGNTSGDLAVVRLRPDAAPADTTIFFADPMKDQAITTFAKKEKAREFRFEGAPEGLSSKDLLVAVAEDGGTLTAEIRSIQKDRESFVLSLKFLEPKSKLSKKAKPPKITAFHGPFTATLRPRGHDRNPRLVPSAEFILDWDTRVPVPDLLAAGRKVIVRSVTGIPEAVSASITGSDPNRRSITLDIPTVDLKGFVIGDTEIYANVALAGHGETKPAKVLGSGNAALVHQRFTLQAENISHIADPSLPGGVRADLKVSADGQMYRQVASFTDHPPDEPVFVVSATEENLLELKFGDGYQGRRLPTGRDNVIVSFRKGAGLSGNLPPGALATLARKHPLVAEVLQLVPATGGDARESLENIRTSAPAGLRANGRAVSVLDYENLAKGIQGVWHARAFAGEQRPGRTEHITVVLVPSGGGALGQVEDSVRGVLERNGLPQVELSIEPFDPVDLEIAVTVRVDMAEFDARAVEMAVRENLLSAFDLRNRVPGAPVYRSEIFQIVETVRGVVNSSVSLLGAEVSARNVPVRRVAKGDDGAIWAIWPRRNQVVYAAKPALIRVESTELVT